MAGRPRLNDFHLLEEAAPTKATVATWKSTSFPSSPEGRRKRGKNVEQKKDVRFDDNVNVDYIPHYKELSMEIRTQLWWSNEERRQHFQSLAKEVEQIRFLWKQEEQAFLGRMEEGRLNETFEFFFGITIRGLEKFIHDTRQQEFGTTRKTTTPTQVVTFTNQIPQHSENFHSKRNIERNHEDGVTHTTKTKPKPLKFSVAVSQRSQDIAYRMGFMDAMAVDNPYERRKIEKLVRKQHYKEGQRYRFTQKRKFFCFRTRRASFDSVLLSKQQRQNPRRQSFSITQRFSTTSFFHRYKQTKPVTTVTMD